MRREPGYSLFDVHLADFLAARSRLSEADLQEFRHLVLELSRAQAAGHSCLPLERRECELAAKSPLVSENSGQTPLVLFRGCLYLHRTFTAEAQLAAGIKEMAAGRFAAPGSEALLDACYGPETGGNDGQRRAVRLVMENELSVISGGPGTGKTTTVVTIIGMLLQVAGADLQVALCAPTGKAAMRLGRAVAESSSGLPDVFKAKEAIPDKAVTLHRLLGAYGNSPRFRHDRDNPLPWDVVVVDEASMIDLAMMSRLVAALKPACRLVLLGDKDQLVSVESGAVLADLVEALPDNTVELTKTYRFDEAIADLARAVNAGDAEASLQLLADLSEPTGLLTDSLREAAGNRFLAFRRLVERVGEVGCAEVFAAFNDFRVLCALRRGPSGVDGLNTMVEHFLSRQGHDCLSRTWYPGRPVLITRNDYSLDLYNGDIGIVLPGADGGLEVVFQRPDGSFRSCLPLRLPPCETAYAMTIHKAQGSEFNDVLVVLPEEDNRILSRELIYTAVTRARRQVLVRAGEAVFREAVSRKIRRASNLKERITSDFS